MNEIKTIQINHDENKEYEPYDFFMNEDILSVNDIREFMFAGDCASSDLDFVGFVRLKEDGYANEVMLVQMAENSLYFRFPEQNWLTQDEIDYFLKQLEDFVKEAVSTKGLSYTVILEKNTPLATNRKYVEYNKQIEVRFFLEK